MSSGRRSILLVVVGVTVWYVATLAFWAGRPLPDTVPVGVDYTLEVPRKVTADVECNTVFESAARDGSPLAPLTPQPEGAPALDYQREVCTSVHSQARALFLADTALVLLVWAAAAAYWVRSRRATTDRHGPLLAS